MLFCFLLFVAIAGFSFYLRTKNIVKMWCLLKTCPTLAPPRIDRTLASPPRSPPPPVPHLTPPPQGSRRGGGGEAHRHSRGLWSRVRRFQLPSYPSLLATDYILPTINCVLLTIALPTTYYLLPTIALLTPCYFLLSILRITTY